MVSTDPPVAVEPVVADTAALATIPAPPGAEADRIAWLTRRLRGAPGDRSVDEVGNLVWRLGEPPYELALLSHVDTVFGADVAHGVVERDGWLCGPGVGDNSLAVATTIAVVERLAAAPHRPLAVVFTVGEEGLGGLRTARHACRTIEARQVIALEGHGLDTVYADAVGSVRARVELTGPGGHSWWDRGRPSAVHGLVDVLSGLLNDVPTGVALNVGHVVGGDAVNALAGHAEALVEGRGLDGEPLNRLADRLAELPVPDGLRLACTFLDRRPPGRLDRSHPLLAAVRAERAALGLRDHIGDGSTDANAALARGIPALALGCARGADMHALAERIELASVPLGVAQLDRVLRRLLTDDVPGRHGSAHEPEVDR